MLLGKAEWVLVVSVLSLIRNTMKQHEGWWGLEEEAEILQKQDFLESVGRREDCGPGEVSIQFLALAGP